MNVPICKYGFSGLTEAKKDCLPYDWGDGWVSVKPFISEIDIADYLADGKIETVMAVAETDGVCYTNRRMHH